MSFRMLSRFLVICHLFICHWNGAYTDAILLGILASGGGVKT